MSDTGTPTAAGTATLELDNADQVLQYIFRETGDKYSDSDLDLVRRAYRFSSEAHRGQTRASGEAYVNHPIEVARILAEMRLDAPSIAGALLHDTLEDTKVDSARLATEFGEQVAALVEGVTKISSLQFDSRGEQQVENLRKMIIAMARDIRVILIKMADRLHNLRTLQYLPRDRQVKIARDTMEIYAPLANRLGMTRIKSELEDGAMYYLHSEEYRDIARRIALKRADREEIVETCITRLREELARARITAEVIGRPKHLYSIYLKMTSQNLPFDEIYDLIGVRVLCDSTSTCYDILGIVHNLWRPVPGRFKDYIAVPKENMYQSLHTTVVGLGGHRIEVQVRTHEMNKFAEEGIAAHWKYKEGRSGKNDLDEKLEWLRRLVDWLKEVRDPGEFMSALRGDVFSETVFCFTPKGDVYELPYGSTPLDFAYNIHTNVGETCSQVMVNNRIVPLRTTLQNGDFVQIITSKNAHPTRDWLDIVKTSRARTKIRHYLKVQHYAQNVERGRDLLAKALRGRSLTVDWAETQKRIEPLLKGFKVSSFDDLMADIGFGSVMAHHVVNRAWADVLQSGQPSQPRTAPPRSRGVPGRSQGVVVEGLPHNTVIHYANCCSPVPGDPIAGFVTKSRGISIHRQDCANFLSNLQAPEGGARHIPAEWDLAQPPTRRVTIRVECTDRKGLLADVTSAITTSNVFILESKTRSRGDVAILWFQIEIRSIEQLNQLFVRLRQVKGVLSLNRIGRNEFH